MSKKFILFCTMVLFAAGYTGLVGCSDTTNEVLVPEYKTSLSEGERNLSSFKDQFPHQYDTYH